MSPEPDQSPRLIFRGHAIERMVERNVSVDDVRSVLIAGETIEDYPNDKPFPSRLVLGWRSTGPLHVVVAEDEASETEIVVTVYEPDPRRWDNGFRRRLR